VEEEMLFFSTPVTLDSTRAQATACLTIKSAARYLPKVAFLLLAWMQPIGFLATCGAGAVEQFDYGLGGKIVCPVWSWAGISK